MRTPEFVKVVRAPSDPPSADGWLRPHVGDVVMVTKRNPLTGKLHGETGLLDDGIVDELAMTNVRCIAVSAKDIAAPDASDGPERLGGIPKGAYIVVVDNSNPEEWRAVFRGTEGKVDPAAFEIVVARHGVEGFELSDASEDGDGGIDDEINEMLGESPTKTKG